jgi:Fe-S-cluster containining protein
VVQRTPQDLLDDYARLGAPCPFLEDGACVIYEVRPICCASHLSISPPERCREGSAEQPLICEATPDAEGLRELALLGEPALALHQETLPALVFRLLTEGFPEVMRRLEEMSAA